MTTEITIAPASEITVHDRLTWAYEQINKAISATEGGMECSGPMWANMQDCRRSIREAMQMLRDGRKPV
jgi:hypothetical protein